MAEWEEHWVVVNGHPYLDIVTYRMAYALGIDEAYRVRLSKAMPYSIDIDMDVIEVSQLPVKIRARHKEIQPLLRIMI